MRLLARAALIVRPKRRFVDWVNSIDHGGPKYTIEEARTNPAVYLVFFEPGDEERTLSDLVDECAEDLFEAQLSQWAQDESAWPSNRSPHGFRQFFDVEAADTVCDIDDDDPIWADAEADWDDEDEPEDFDEDIELDEGEEPEEDAEDVEATEDDLKALHDLAITVSRCAWCERDIPEDGLTFPLVFAFLQPPDADRDPDDPLVTFRLPRAGRTLTGVRPPPDEDPVPGADLVITVCSEACRAALVVAVEKETEPKTE